MNVPTGEQCATVALALPTERRLKIGYEEATHGMGHNAGICAKGTEPGDIPEFDFLIVAAAAHLLAKTNPELSAALCLESERVLHEMAKEP